MLFTRKSLTCKCECLPYNASHLVSTLIGTWYNVAFIRGFFSNPLKSLVRFWSLQSSFEEYIVGSWLPPNILVKAIFATWLTNTLSHFEKMNAEWFLIGVDSFVCIQCTWLFAFVITLFAAEWLITSVGSYMRLRLPDCRAFVATLWAAEWFFVGVDSFMCLQCSWLFTFVITPFAAKWFFINVDSFMSLQNIC